MALDPGRLISGWNTLAAEVHNQSLTSSDIGFDFELTADAIIDPLPTLRIAISSSQVVLSWPSDASYFAPYSAIDLAPPIQWTKVSASPILMNGFWSISLNPELSGSRFFTLKVP